MRCTRWWAAVLTAAVLTLVFDGRSVATARPLEAEQLRLRDSGAETVGRNPLPRSSSAAETKQATLAAAADDGAGSRAHAPLAPLRFQPSSSAHAGSFKIMVVTDTHLLDDQTVPGNASNVSRASAAAAATYLATETPDFVVHLGDIVSGEAANSTADVRGAVRQILAPIVRAGIPFATAKGNHDNDVYSTHAAITDMEHELAPHLSYTRKAPRGVGGGATGSDNYWLPVYGPECATGPPALLLWFFDSRSGRTLKSQGSMAIDDWVDASVAPWVRNETARMERDWGQLPPSLVFVHIPVHAHLTAQTEDPIAPHVGGVTNETSSALQGGNDSGKRRQRAYPGLNDDKPAATQGGEDDGVPYAEQDRPFLDALLGGPAGKARILAITSGHDHGNDWCAPSSETTATGQIVPLCFAKHSGFGGYDYTQWNHGVRVFDVHQANLDAAGVQTHIRFLTGEERYNTSLDDDWAHKLLPN